MIYLTWAVNLAVLIYGIALLSIAISWKPQVGRFQFIGFVALTFVAIPTTQFLFFGFLYLADASWGSNEVAQWMVLIDACLLVLMFINTMVLLMTFTIARIPGDSSPAAQRQSAEGASSAGEVWETTMTPQLSIGILRRREWAFLIDCMPSLLTGLAILGLAAWSSQYSSSYRIPRVGLFTMRFLSIAEPFLLFYVLFRDSVGGASFGKRIARIRVVNRHDGRLAAFGTCLIRNLIFAIPIMALVELAVASIRNDRRRIGDLLANTVVVTGPPNTVGGISQNATPPTAEATAVAVKHPLDD